MATTDKVAFMVSMDGSKLSYKSLVDKIKEKYAETVNIYPRIGSPGTQPQKVKAKDIDVLCLRNYQGMHIDDKVSMETICSMDPFPQSPTIGVVLRKDAERSPAAAQWQFRGTTLEFVTAPTNAENDVHMADSAAAQTSSKLSTPSDKIKKRKAEHITTDVPPVVLSSAVNAKVDSIVASGMCKRDELDDVALGRLAGIGEDKKALEVLDKFVGPEIETCDNKSRHLMKIIREMAGSASPVKAKTHAAAVPAKEEESAKKSKTETVSARALRHQMVSAETIPLPASSPSRP